MSGPAHVNSVVSLSPLQVVPLNLPSSPSNQPRIGFDRFLQPLIELVTSSRNHVYRFSVKVAEICHRIGSATYVIFYRLTHKPIFSPNDLAFKKSIKQLEEQISLIQDQIDHFNQKFWKDHLISRDVQELHKLHNGIQEHLSKLNGYMNVLEKRTHPFPIQKQISQVRDSFQHLDDRMSLYCLQQGESILEKFKTTVNLFMQGGTSLPQDIRLQLIQTWNSLQKVIDERICLPYITPAARAIRSKYAEISTLISILDKKDSNSHPQVNRAEPLKLRNIGQSCYLDSVLQATLCIDQVREKMEELITQDPQDLQNASYYQKKLSIQKELLQFIEVQKRDRGEEGAMTQMEFILFLLQGPSQSRLRQAIFESGFHPELRMSRLTHQHDASNVLELFLNHFLTDYKFKWRGHASTPIFPGIEFVNGGLKGQDEELAMLQVSLRTAIDPKNQTLSRLVQILLGKHIQTEKNPTNQREFDPSEGKVMAGQEDKAALVSAAAATKVDTFDEWYRLTNLPPVLTLQFKRFTSGVAKDNRIVKLPTNGILDLTPYYDAPEGAPKQARYKIKSIIRHLGSTLKSGHYVADVEINGKYFYCNDSDPTCYYREITAKEFYGREDAYMLFLEQLPDDDK